MGLPLFCLPSKARHCIFCSITDRPSLTLLQAEESKQRRLHPVVWDKIGIFFFVHRLHKQCLLTRCFVFFLVFVTRVNDVLSTAAPVFWQSNRLCGQWSRVFSRSFHYFIRVSGIFTCTSTPVYQLTKLDLPAEWFPMIITVRLCYHEESWSHNCCNFPQTCVQREREFNRFRGRQTFSFTTAPNCFKPPLLSSSFKMRFEESLRKYVHQILIVQN